MRQPPAPPPALLLSALLALALAPAATAARPRLLGCRPAAVDELLPSAVFSSFGDGGDCAALCGRQAALLAARSQRWCFCLNQPAAAANLTAACAGPAPAGLEMLRFFALDGEPAAAAADAGPPAVRFGQLQLEFVRCAGGPVDSHLVLVDGCVHDCTSQQRPYVALGSRPGPDTEFYLCGCGTADVFGDTLPAARCDRRCRRGGETLAMSCGGELDGAPAYSVYWAEEAGTGSTPTPLTTTQHSTRSGVCKPSSQCPDQSILVGGSCYILLPLDVSAHEQAITPCRYYLSDSNWLVWAIEDESELREIYESFMPSCMQDGGKVLTSGLVQPDNTVIWDGWEQNQNESEPVRGWLLQQVNGTKKVNSSIVLENDHNVYQKKKFVYYDMMALPSKTFVLCEKKMLQTTTAATSTTSSQTTTAAPDTTTDLRTSTLPLSTTAQPVPVTPDDEIKDMIDWLNNTASSINGTDIIDVVNQLDSIIEHQRNATQNMTAQQRLSNNTQFTADLVQLVDTLLSSTVAWRDNMTQMERYETSMKLMNSTEAAGFLLATSTADANSSDIIETAQPTLVLSAGSVDRLQPNTSFTFPNGLDEGSWIQLPAGYQHLVPDAGDRLPQVGVLYRASELLSLLLTPANSLADRRKQVNSPLVSFTLGAAGHRVVLPGTGARLRLRYRRPARQPPGRDVWRRLYPGEAAWAVPGSAVCVYWSDVDSEWRKLGCRLVEDASSKDHASCICSHLTNFAILMDYHDYVGTPLSLSVLTWVLGSLSFICLLLTVIVFSFASPLQDVPDAVRSLRCSRTKITRNLCAVYAVGLVLVLTVMDRRLVNLAPTACSAVGMAIHFCFLSVFAWSMVEGVHLYKVLRHVFEPRSNSMTRYYMYGYLVPALIVIVTNTVALGTGEYAYVRDEFCWLTAPYFIWFFNGPMALVLLMNIFVIILAYRSANSLKVNQLRAKKEKIKRWLKSWFSLSCMLSVQWIIGYVYVDGSNVLDYVFTVLNCSQGILIFVFHCLLRSRTRQILLGRFSTAKSSTMMNSVYGQIVMAQNRTRLNRQPRPSQETSVTTLSSRQATISSGSLESSPASERSHSSGSSGSRKLYRQTSGGRQLSRQVTSRATTEGQQSGSLRGRVNLAFQPEDPWKPLPDISEEAEAGSPRSEPRLQRTSRSSRQSAVSHTDSVEVYRSRSVGALRHGHLH